MLVVPLPLRVAFAAALQEHDYLRIEGICFPVQRFGGRQLVVPAASQFPCQYPVAPYPTFVKSWSCRPPCAASASSSPAGGRLTGAIEILEQIGPRQPAEDINSLLHSDVVLNNRDLAYVYFFRRGRRQRSSAGRAGGEASPT